MAAVVHELPIGSHMAVDDRGIGLRVTWRLQRGFVNLSLWRDDRCVETFHLQPAAAADLVAFLVRGLADASSVAAMAPLLDLPDRSQRPPLGKRLARGVVTAVDDSRVRTSNMLDAAARLIRPR